MRTLVPVALLALASTSAGARETHFPFEYLDLLGAEAVGEFAARAYDVNETIGTEKDRFTGNVALKGGQLYGGGLGLRLVMRFDCGLRLSTELSGTFGRLYNVDGPWSSYSSVTRAEILGGVGYEWTIGERLVLHTATIIGVQFQDFDAAGLRAAQAALMSPSTGAGAALPPGFSLQAIDLRLGQQVGLHVQVAKMVALYGDATFDYDGQWRVRAGVAIGAPHKPRS
jgi:hypothetical protein